MDTIQTAYLLVLDGGRTQTKGVAAQMQITEHQARLALSALRFEGGHIDCVQLGKQRFWCLPEESAELRLLCKTTRAVNIRLQGIRRDARQRANRRGLRPTCAEIREQCEAQWPVVQRTVTSWTPVKTTGARSVFDLVAA